MSEAELVETWVSMHDVAISSLMFYLSIASGYLIVAYAVGPQLERSQAFFITCLFVAFSVFAAWSAVGHTFIAEAYRAQLSEDPRLSSTIRPYQVIAPILILGILGSLKFMWDVRRPKS